MEVFTADQLPAIHTLAAEFCVCDHWHSEVPGPTEPNRLFMHAATATGLTYNPWQYDTLNVPTIYERIETAGRDWAMYGFDLFDSTNFDGINGKAARQTAVLAVSHRRVRRKAAVLHVPLPSLLRRHRRARQLPARAA